MSLRLALPLVLVVLVGGVASAQPTRDPYAGYPDSDEPTPSEPPPMIYVPIPPPIVAPMPYVTEDMSAFIVGLNADLTIDIVHSAKAALLLFGRIRYDYVDAGGVSAYSHGVTGQLGLGVRL